MCALLVTLMTAALAGDDLGLHVAVLARHGPGGTEGRAAWQRLVDAGPRAVPILLEAMDTPDVVRANWFFTALDRIDAAHAALDEERLLAFARDVRRQGRARRVAVEMLERRRPGTLGKLLPHWTEDPEFRYEALEQVLQEAAGLLKVGKTEMAQKRYRFAFDRSREIEQARKAAVGLLDLGVEVSIARHLGFLMDWHVIGPFDSAGNQGFKKSYRPEEKVELDAEYEANGRKLRWKKYTVAEPSARMAAKHVALVNLREARALGDADDAVAFAFTEFTLERPVKAEFRGAADDNFTVWVNGKRVFGFEEYRNGVRFDRHRFAVDLPAGKNSVLVKICQTPAPNPEPNWEFLLRVIDEAGKGVAYK